MIRGLGVGLALGGGAALVLHPVRSATELPPRIVPIPVTRCAPAPLAPSRQRPNEEDSEVRGREARARELHRLIELVTGPAIPWSEVSEEARPEGVEARLAALPDGFSVRALNCLAYPCVATLAVPPGSDCDLDSLGLSTGPSVCGPGDPSWVLTLVDPERSHLDDVLQVEHRLRNASGR